MECGTYGGVQRGLAVVCPTSTWTGLRLPGPAGWARYGRPGAAAWRTAHCAQRPHWTGTPALQAGSGHARRRHTPAWAQRLSTPQARHYNQTVELQAEQHTTSQAAQACAICCVQAHAPPHTPAHPCTPTQGFGAPPVFRHLLIQALPKLLSQDAHPPR